MLITNNEKIRTSPLYMGYLILKKLRTSNDEKIMMYELVENLKGELGIVHYRQLVFSLIFLYQSGIIDFAEPYIYKK